MLRDVFYYGKKPNVHPRERYAENLDHARSLSTTDHFWIINEFSDYTNFDWDFDFEFLPDEDVWAEDHTNVWPSQHQKDSGTWLCTKDPSELIVYRNDVDPVRRKNEKNENWVLLDLVDESKFDFSWHPDPTDPPYIYRWGCKFFPVQLKHVLEYRVPGATQVKYLDTIVELLPQTELWVEHQPIDKDYFDLSWRPDPMDPPFIYVWGNKYVDGKLKPTLEYHAPGATNKKYMPELLKVLPEWDRWVEHIKIDKSKFDFSWRPDPREPAYIYVWGNKYEEAELKPTLEYHCPDATEVKYMGNTVEVLPEWNRWKIIEDIDKTTFDFTWRPDPREPALIYVFGNDQYDGTIMPTVEYVMEGATERKYVNNWTKPKLKANKDLFEHLENSDGIDYSWRPNPTSPPYIYAWGNQWNKPEDKISIQYVVEGATEYKYMEERAIRKPCMDNWEVPKDVDTTGFDFSWEPSPADPAYIYEFGTQWQKTGGPRYVVKNATEVKYMDLMKVKKLPSTKNWTIPSYIDKKTFDFSWHPDSTSPAYVYHFPTQWAIAGGPVYTVEGATENKFVELPIATAVPSFDNWEIPNNVDKDSFDYSWHPYVDDQPYIYQFGTQHQKTGGHRYITPGTHKNSPVLYVDTRIIKSKRLEDKSKFTVLNDYKIKDFDYSWHPDETEEPYIYVFGNTQYPAEIMPTIEYRVLGATTVKYVNNVVATLDDDRTNWVITQPIDEESFDFSWKPNPKDPPYIYRWGNKHISNKYKATIEYVVPGATDIKYMDDNVKVLPEWDRWVEHVPVDKLLSVTKGFDFTWRPDPREPAFIYVWGNKYVPAEITPTLEYRMPDATEIKYMGNNIEVSPQWDRWEIPKDVDTTGFDFTWRPDPLEPNLIWEFATQWQKTGGPRYVIPGATEVKYIDTQKVKKLPSMDNWTIPSNIDATNFDFSWHPDATSPPYIYHFPTQWALSGGPTYTVEGATEKKYVEDQQAVAVVDKTNWEYDSNLIDVDSFDFSWHPYVEDQPYIYVFGTQHQKTGGPKYITPGCHKNSPVKYIDTRIIKAKRLPSKDNWHVIDDNVIADFDYSWHPDETEEPYIYQFGNNLYPAEIMPTIEYRVRGATQVKYISNIIAKLGPNKNNWVVPKNVDASEFDFSWRPNPKDPAYIYEFGTQWQKTGGPQYVVEGATEKKYIDTSKAKRLPSKKNWTVPKNIDVTEFDFSWHPDDTSPPYNYVFATQWALSGGPVYSVEGATEVKYIEDQYAKALPDRTNWVYDEKLIDIDSFDFSWHPYVEDQPYIYQFGTQHQKTGGPKYITPGADSSSPIKYIDTRIIKAKRLPSMGNWNIIDDLPVQEFDYSWHPDETEEPYIYVFGNTQYPAEIMPTVEYIMPNAKQIKYVNSVVAKLAKDLTNWIVPDNLDTSEFDFSWRPNPKDPPYIYEFGTQWQKTDGPQYVVEGATERKYVDGSKAKRLPNKENWTVPSNIDSAGFDFSWHPDNTSPAYIYVFATQWALSGGPIYTVPGATEVKYIEDQYAKALPDRTNWVFDATEIDVDSFDFSWHPYVEDQPYIYQFGTQWQKTGGPRYITPGADSSSPVKYIDTRIIKAKRLPNKSKFFVPKQFKIKDFDWSWHPDDTSPPYIYVFGNNLYPAEECATVEYRVPTGKEVKFVKDIVAKLDKNMSNWEIPDNVDVRKFDFSWIPHPAAPPYIYQFGTLKDPTDGPRYITPNTNGEVVKLPRIEIEEEVVVEAPTKELPVAQYYIETTLEALVAQHETELFWALNPDIDYSNFDFDWRPSIEQAEYVHAFGSAASEKTQTYFINGPQWAKGNRDINWVQNVELTEKALAEMFVKPDMFYVDKGNPESQSRFDMLKAKFGTKIQKTRYLNSWVDTINRCVNRSTTTMVWVLNSELDYTNFDFNYYPNPWQMKMVHVFGTQWSHWGTTFMINRETFPTDTKYIKIIEHLNNLNFVKDNRARATNCVYDIVLIDHGNNETTKVAELLKSKAGDKQVSVVKYDTSYLTTLRNIVSKQPEKKEHYLWLCSSICEYRDFDFSYICDPFAKDQLHVFPSGKQKFGDTFFIDVNKTRDIINDLEILEDYNKVNYNATMRVNRMPEPVLVTADDTHTEIAKQIEGFPYAVITTEQDINLSVTEYEPMNLWSPKTKNIIVTSTGASRIVVPREAKDHIKKELYDYPYIKKAAKLAISQPMDIVFLSNGETGAEENWEHLLRVTKGLKNRVVRVDGVNGRVAAYHAAAEASNTPWLFTVFAKLKVSPKFDFNWQPDRMQSAKHYIFQAKNPVNGLIYGHQAMIAYNKKLTLNNEGKGLDFTLDDEHEVVELLSGTAMYNTDEFSTWRTAFREVLKLRQENSDIARERLDAWLNKAEGDFAQYSIKGAVDADEYYDEVDGDFEKLKLSYEWQWLRERFDQL